MKLTRASASVTFCLALSTFTQAQDAQPAQAVSAPQTRPLDDGGEPIGTVSGEKIGADAIAPGVIEDMSVVLERERAHAGEPVVNPKARHGGQGTWVVPAQRFAKFPHSGTRYAFNKWGDTRMGIGFKRVVDVDGAWFAGQGGEDAWAAGVQVVGFRAGAEVARTAWFEDIDATSSYFALNLKSVDRIEILARASLESSGWYALDDLAFHVDGAERVIDFEDTEFGKKLTGSTYASLDWETGSGEFSSQSGTDYVHAPVTQPLPGENANVVTDGLPKAGGLGTNPTLTTNFIGPKFGDSGAGFIPPDTVGAIGPNHFLASVNANLSAYNRTTGARVLNVALSSFFGAGVGDPRVGYDQHAGRWIVLASDFSTRVYFAYSLTNDPTGSWFKTNINVSQGADAGLWPDYPTLGFDANGVYFSCFMVPAGMSIFAVDKAPLLGGTPTMGTVTAFRGLPYESAIQPCVTYGTAPGEFCISRTGPTSLRVRRVNAPLTAPTLANVGTVTVPVNAAPPNATALGSSPALDALDGRLMNSIYRNGSIWTVHCIGVSGKAAARFYQLTTGPLTSQQVGTISDPTLNYFMPSIAVNVAGDCVLGFSGSSTSQFVGSYLCGRKSTDAAGETGVPILVKAGEGSYNNTDGNGNNRWGDYSLTSVDPLNDIDMWTAQEYARSGNSWGTWIAATDYNSCPPPTAYCTAKVNSELCVPTIGFTGTPSAAGAPFTVTGVEFLNKKFGLLFYGTQPLGAAFQGGHLCVKAPTKRTPPQNAGGSPTGNDCTGTYAVDFNALIQAGTDPNLVAGAFVHVQWWARDPGDFTGFGTSLSDALKFEICP
ncbi:MAG: hypothetical protein K8S98_14495 [Planctomycetes bacterium]|nr:hypothetical protein [Planctomycetota bacterium]